MARQDGVVSLAQAVEAGMSTTAVDRRVSGGDWRRLDRGVFIRADRTHTAAVELRAAVLGAGADACAFGPSAAWWHGLLDRAPREQWVTVPRGRCLQRQTPCRVRRRTLHRLDVSTVRSLRVTSLPLTVLEAAVALPKGSVSMDRALQRHTTLPILAAVHERNPGRRGAAAAARLLRSAGEGGASEAERMLLRLLRGAGLAGWRPHVTSHGYEIDVAFARRMVAVEVDGWAWHRGVERFNHDAARQNVLVNAGWHVLRFTWHHLVHEPEKVLAQIVTALDR
ncbi:type IV toxin-antitoxin system AbiEi family antitoxin domain-containing protein [Prescottella subtropica]|uniref:type IV toxin-antitoxin system AbiEi family antitoxin domain-containing protein n=1 Tax=Prescottella subtropica TaxID=2545757 RepID=UPI001F4FFC5C|nr:type IV toxin-antitoxin system AbiEi family antitoxin domain-containing protein [Prescottella subtropica]